MARREEQAETGMEEGTHAMKRPNLSVQVTWWADEGNGRVAEPRWGTPGSIRAVWCVVLSPLTLGRSCHLRLWPFLCNQGLRTLHHISAHSSNIWRKSRKVGQTPGPFGAQPEVPRLALNKSRGELLLLPGGTGAVLQDSRCTCPGRVARGSCAKNQDPCWYTT